MVLNSPNNPTGRVFSVEELQIIAGLCREIDALAITDEIYEHIVYDGARHVPIMTLPGMRERSVLVNSLSKTFSVTGWRVWLGDRTTRSYIIHPQSSRFPDRRRRCSSAASRNSRARTPRFIFSDLSAMYERKRNLLIDILGQHGSSAQFLEALITLWRTLRA